MTVFFWPIHSFTENKNRNVSASRVSYTSIHVMSDRNCMGGNWLVINQGLSCHFGIIGLYLSNFICIRYCLIVPLLIVIQKRKFVTIFSYAIVTRRSQKSIKKKDQSIPIGKSKLQRNINQNPSAKKEILCQKQPRNMDTPYKLLRQTMNMKAN